MAYDDEQTTGELPRSVAQLEAMSMEELVELGARCEAELGVEPEAAQQRGAELCLAHSGQTRLDSVKGAQQTAEVRRAKAQARRETLRDKLARKLEEHADEVVAAYLAGDPVR